ncbi:MAG: carboxypeptidase-like regulatory domain-containing protein [Planctomycetota bacterium]
MESKTRLSKAPWITAAASALLAFWLVHALLPTRSAPTTPVVEPVSLEAGVAHRLPPDDLATVSVAPSDEGTLVRGEASVAPRSRSEAGKGNIALAGGELRAGEGKEADVEGLLFGAITDESGEPLEGVFLHTRSPKGAVLSTATDGRGRYSLGPLQEGRWQVEVHKEGRHCPELKVSVTASDDQLRRDLTLARQQIVRVLVETRDGRPAVPVLRELGLFSDRSSLVPVATRTPMSGTTNEDSVDLWQSFGVGRQMWDTNYERQSESEFTRLSVIAPTSAWFSLISDQCVLQSVQVAEDAEGVRFVVDPEDLLALRGTVRATVADQETGEALMASVTLRVREGSQGKPRMSDATTGEIIHEDQRPGSLSWTATLEGYADVTRDVVLAPGATVDLGTVLMPRPVALEGTVVDSDGSPLVGVLALQEVDGAGALVALRKNTRFQSQPDGSFAISGLPPGRYQVQVRGLEAAPPRPFDPRLRSIPVVIDARQGAVTGIQLRAVATTHLSFPTGKLEAPWPYLEAIDAEGRVVDETWLGRWFSEAWVDLPPGDYTLRIRRGDGSVGSQEAQVGEEPLRIPLDLK